MIGSALAALEERFLCVPYTAPITRARCAEMHRQGEAGAREKCRGCVVGRAHVRALPSELVALTWADGSPVELAPAPGAAPAPAERPRVVLTPLAPPRPEPARREPTPMAAKLTHDGITDTYEGWGKRLGVTGAAIRMRMKRHKGDLSKVLVRSDAPTRPRVISENRGAALARDIAATARREGEQAARRAALDARARGDEKVAKKPRAMPTPAVEAARAVREQLTALDPLELLRRLGWKVDELGPTPAGRLFVLGGDAR